MGMSLSDVYFLAYGFSSWIFTVFNKPLFGHTFFYPENKTNKKTQELRCFALSSLKFRATRFALPRVRASCKYSE